MPHVDIELEDNKQFISNIPRIIEATSKGLGKPVHKHSLMRAFAVRRHVVGTDLEEASDKNVSTS